MWQQPDPEEFERWVHFQQLQETAAATAGHEQYGYPPLGPQQQFGYPPLGRPQQFGYPPQHFGYPPLGHPQLGYPSPGHPQQFLSAPKQQQQRGYTHQQRRYSTQNPQKDVRTLQQPTPAGNTPGLASVQSKDQRTALGRRLCPEVEKSLQARFGQGIKAPKITGMLLELDNAEVTHLLAERPALEARITEALQLLGLPSS